MMRVEEKKVAFAADDGTRLAGTWFAPRDPEPRAVIVVVPGAGIPARAYHRLGRHLAEGGAAVLAFDYRGVGASRPRDMRALAGGMDVWSLQDIGAALREARAAFPTLPLQAVAHSVGTLLLGAAPGSHDVSRAVFLAPHTGYWRDYHPKWRTLLFLVWHALMPAFTRVWGYFPGRMLHLGEDLPHQVALDWAQRRQASLIATQEQARRFGPWLPRYGLFRAPTLVVSVTDDAFAPPAAARRLLDMYPNVPAEHRTFAPGQLAARRLGHFAFVGRTSGEHFWRMTAAWLLPDTVAEQGSTRAVGTGNGGHAVNR